MPGFYEHEEIVHTLEIDGDSEDDQAEQFDVVVKQPIEKPRSPVSAASRPSTSSTRLEDIPPEIYHSTVSEPKPLSKSNVGHQVNRSDSDASDNKPQICPICSQILMTDNQGLNAHVDFCLSRTAIQEARNEGRDHESGTPARKPVSMKSPVASMQKGWDFLMGQKDVLPTQPKSAKKRK
jgi:DNA polymerase kappa